MALSLRKANARQTLTEERRSLTREARRGVARRETRRETSLHWNVSGKGVSLWNVKPSRRRAVVNEHRLLPGRYFAGLYLFSSPERRRAAARRKKMRRGHYFITPRRSLPFSLSLEGFSRQGNRRTHRRINPVSTLR